MSDYTTQLRFICESYAGRTAEGSVFDDIDTIIDNSRSKVFDFDYPIFDESYKPELETKIINHFYTQEIGQETVGLFKQRLKTKMREIMPYYNQLYLSEKLKFNPFINADYIDTHNQQSEGNIQGRGTSNTITTGKVDVTGENTERTKTDNIDTGTYSESGTDEKTRDVDVTTNETENVQGSGTKDITETNGNTKTLSGSSADIAIQEGTDMGVSIPAIDKRTLKKVADTPLGQLTSGSSVDNQHNAGIGPGGINSGYLSGVEETVENYNGEAYTDSNDHYHPRNHDYNETRHGLYYDLSKDGQKVRGDQRHDDSVHVNGAEMKWHEPGEDETHGHWSVKRDENGDIVTNNANLPKEQNNGSKTVDEDTTDTKDRTTDGTSNTDEQEQGQYSKSGNTRDVLDGTKVVNGSHEEHTTSRGTDDNTTTNTQDTKEKQDYFGKVFGKVGSETYSEMLMKFRDTFLNIDMMVIKDLEPLFMLVW